MVFRVRYRVQEQPVTLNDGSVRSFPARAGVVEVNSDCRENAVLHAHIVATGFHPDRPHEWREDFLRGYGLDPDEYPLKREDIPEWDEVGASRFVECPVEVPPPPTFEVLLCECL